MEIIDEIYGICYFQYTVKYKNRSIKLVSYEFQSHSCLNCIRIVKKEFVYFPSYKQYFRITNLRQIYRKYLIKFESPIEAF